MISALVRLHRAIITLVAIVCGSGFALPATATAQISLPTPSQEPPSWKEYTGDDWGNESPALIMSCDRTQAVVVRRAGAGTPIPAVMLFESKRAFLTEKSEIRVPLGGGRSAKWIATNTWRVAAVQLGGPGVGGGKAVSTVGQMLENSITSPDGKTSVLAREYIPFAAFSERSDAVNAAKSEVADDKGDQGEFPPDMPKTIDDLNPFLVPGVPPDPAAIEACFAAFRANARSAQTTFKNAALACKVTASGRAGILWPAIGIIGGAAIGGGIAFWTCEPGDYWAPIFGGGALGLSLGQSYGQHRADLAAIKACVDTARQQRDNTMEQHVAELKKCLGRLGYWF